MRTLILSIIVAAFVSCTQQVEVPARFYYIAAIDNAGKVIHTDKYLVEEPSIMIVWPSAPGSVYFTRTSFKKDGNNVQCYWQVESEFNLARYDVMRSDDNMNFKVVGSVPPKGQGSDYYFTDYAK
jgi:hypothetical protein